MKLKTNKIRDESLEWIKRKEKDFKSKKSKARTIQEERFCKGPCMSECRKVFISGHKWISFHFKETNWFLLPFQGPLMIKLSFNLLLMLILTQPV